MFRLYKHSCSFAGVPNVKIDGLRAGSALAALAMILEAVFPSLFFFLPLAGGDIEQFAVFVGGAYVMQELYGSFRG